jgi:hypothetical protein
LEYDAWNCIFGDGSKPRLNRAKGYFRDLQPSTIPLLTSAYETWVGFDEHIVVHGANRKTGEDLYLAIKASKRGNDVYRRKVKKRFEAFDTVPNASFFNDSDIAKGTAFTPCLFFTLTYDTKFCSLEDAWLNIGIEFNRWISRLQQKYGRISVLRTWQDFNNGYPHVHGVLLFKEHEFKIQYKEESPVLHGETKTIYRIEGHEDFRQSWHSFVDVSACYNVKGAISYARRYITRGIMKGEDYRSPMQDGGSLSSQCLALNWLYRKRSFSVSGDFRKLVSDLIASKRNSKLVFLQNCLDGSSLPVSDGWVWSLIGVYHLRESEQGDLVSLSCDRVRELIDNAG